MNEEITLVHGQQVKVKEWKYRPVVKVGTLEGYAAQYNESPDVAYARECKRCLNQGQPPIGAWTTHSGAMLTANYPGKDAEMERKRQAYEDAVELHERQIVVIEGRRYFVHITDKDWVRHSDPIEFKIIPEFPEMY